MCRPQPFPRCSNHAKKRKESTARRYRQISDKQVELVNSGVSEKEIEKNGQRALNALNKYVGAVKDWEESPDGLKRLARMKAALESRGETEKAVEYGKRLKAATERRDKKMAVAKGRLPQSSATSQSSQPQPPTNDFPDPWDDGTPAPVNRYSSTITRTDGRSYSFPSYHPTSAVDSARAFFGNTVSVRGGNTIVRPRVDGTLDILGYVSNKEEDHV